MRRLERNGSDDEGTEGQRCWLDVVTLSWLRSTHKLHQKQAAVGAEKVRGVAVKLMCLSARVLRPA
jgi:hypothetical protein